MKKSKESVKYQTMLNEVETIVADIEASDTDLDVLVNKVEKGFEIIKLMKERLQETQVKIETLRNDHEQANS